MKFIAQLSLVFVLLSGSVAAQNPHRALLLISVDGLRPDYISEANKYGLGIPVLRTLWRVGAHATSVRGVLPTSTYPSHTSLITGNSPVHHGIAANQPFNPAGNQPSRWFWYAEDIHVPTLWDAAHQAGIEVGSVSWPVTVGAEAIKYNIPDFSATRSDEDAKMIRAWAGLSFMRTLEKNAGPLVTEVDEGVNRDWSRTRYVTEIIRLHKPGFMIAHFVAADHYQHQYGPFTPQVFAALEEIDKMIGQLIAEMRREYPGAAVCVVSDHGFSPAQKGIALNAVFVREGLITVKSQGSSIQAAKLEDWIAMPWASGGSAAIVLKDPTDESARHKVKNILDNLAEEQANGIARILDRESIARFGGTSQADFWVDLRPGYTCSPLLSGLTVVAAGKGGTHGYVPTHAEMGSVFVLSGPGIRSVDIGAIDMRSIAPTLALWLRVPFPAAELPALELVESGR